MFLVMVNDNAGILEELVLVTADLEKAQQHFLDTCQEHLSNWDEYTDNDKEALLDLGYEKLVCGRAVVLVDTDGPTSDAEIAAEMADEVFYVWKEFVTVEGETEPRLLTPRRDPMLHEYPFDYLSETAEAAIELKKELAEEEEDWVLCRETLTRVKGWSSGEVGT